MKQEVSSFWHTPEGYKGIGIMELLSIKSFIDNGYKFVLYTYNLDDIFFKKMGELFDDFELKDASDIIPFENYFSDDRGAGVAAFSDYFRFNLLYLKGGVWVDLDMVCLKYTDLSQEYIFSQEIDKDETKPRVTTSFLKFPKNSNFGKSLIQEAEKIVDNRKIIPWGIIGPWFLADEVKKWNLEKYAWDYKQTCQISCFKIKDFISKRKKIDETRPFLHLFSDMWRAKKMDKNLLYKDGIYGSLLAKHHIDKLLNDIDYPDIMYFSRKNFLLEFIDKIKSKLKI